MKISFTNYKTFKIKKKKKIIIQATREESRGLIKHFSN